MKHPIRKLIISFVATFVATLFAGAISFDQYFGYLHPPSFPFQYSYSPCLPCYGTYSLGLASADFAIWYTAASVGLFAIISLLTADSTIHLGIGKNGFSLQKKVAHRLGFLLVFVLMIAIFVPVIPTPGGYFQECSGFAPNHSCTNETQIGSITYSLFCQGGVWDLPSITTTYRFTDCVYF